MMSFVQRILVDSDHHEFVMPEDARKRCSCGNVTSDLIALLPTNIIAYITIWQFTQVYEKTFNVNSKIAQTMQNI